ncbi:Y-family DNA polymerase [Noviherbaspirillum galbum]|uniref:DNA polymerase Y family protein n=1 Tax=Noviherbaspirillum galbum TaxID=2709383 RepID=A0A6B3SQM1_9BURK|nr:DNA polymerase Y family protein [Noviherbaspirillum galbum]NEX62818.1 DNA polymerase Y family protein [Noviherbaspirillum galbum]
MRTWIGVHLPLLPLETIRPRWSEPGRHAVIDREHVLTMSPEAAAAGVRLAMRRASVKAICPDAVLHDHDATREQDALYGIALAMLQYTPEVAHAEESSLLLDVTASLRAFGGRRALCRLVRGSVEALGFTPRIAMAPSARAAWLFARHPGRMVRRMARPETAMRRLDALPCALVPAARPYVEWLEGLGCHALGELRRLPRPGLQRRTDQHVLHALDCAYGQAPELFDWVQAPRRFAARLDMPDRIEHAEALLFGARRLLLQMTGWLVAQQVAVSRFTLLLEHERGRTAIPPTPLEIALAEPAWQEEHLTRLLKERLGRITLEAPVIALRLEAAQVEAMLPPTASLFPEPGGSASDYRRLVELLTARLGEQNVLVPAPRADHRPEVCNGWRPAASANRVPPVTLPAIERPFWMLEQPVALMVKQHRPFYGSPLWTLRGPERIESGWWDGGLAVRDYYTMQGANGRYYWVYRVRFDEGDHWFLQGVYG